MKFKQIVRSHLPSANVYQDQFLALTDDGELYWLTVNATNDKYVANRLKNVGVNPSWELTQKLLG